MNRWNRQFECVSEVREPFLDIRGYKARQSIYGYNLDSLYYVIESKHLQNGRLRKKLHEQKQKCRALRRHVKLLAAALEALEFEYCKSDQKAVIKLLKKLKEET